MLNETSKNPPSTESPASKSLWLTSSVVTTGAVILAVTGSAIASPEVLIGAAIVGGVGALTGVLAVKKSSA